MSDGGFERQPQRVKSEARISWETLQELGFREGQDKSGPNQIEHNAGLYNLNGKKIGWGDINAADIDLFVKSLPEPLLILDENASYWKFVTVLGQKEMSETKKGPGSTVILDNNSPLIRHVARSESNPGLEYILKNIRGLVVPNTMIFQDSGFLSPGYYSVNTNGDNEEDRKIPGTNFEYHLVQRKKIVSPLRECLIRTGFLPPLPPEPKKNVFDKILNRLKRKRRLR